MIEAPFRNPTTLRRACSIANIIQEEMSWMNGWATSKETERECAEKAALKILKKISRWKAPKP